MFNPKNTNHPNSSPTSLDMTHESTDSDDILIPGTQTISHTTTTEPTLITSQDLSHILTQLTISLTNTIENRLETMESKITKHNTQINAQIASQIAEHNAKIHETQNHAFETLESKIKSQINETLETKINQTLQTHLAEHSTQITSHINEQNLRMDEQHAQLVQNIEARLAEQNVVEHLDEVKQIVQRIETAHSEDIAHIHSRLDHLESFCENAQANNQQFNEALNELKVEHQNTVTNIQTTIKQDHENTIKHIRDTQHETHQLLEVQNTRIDECAKRIEELEQRPVTMGTCSNIPEIIVNLPSTSTDSGTPKFSGRSLNPIEFLSKLRKLYQRLVRNRTQMDTADILHETVELSLESYASRWWQLIKDDVTNWEQFEQAFLLKYWNKHVQQGILKRMELEKFHRNGRQNRTEYVDSRVVLLRSMTPELTDEEIIEKLAEHFDELIQHAVKVQNIHKITDFQLLLQKEDVHDSNTNLRDQNSTPPTNSFPRRNQPNHNYNKNQHSYKDHFNRYSHTHLRNNYHPYRPSQDHRASNNKYPDKRPNTPTNFKGSNQQPHYSSPPRNFQHTRPNRNNFNPNNNYYHNRNSYHPNRTNPASDPVSHRYPSQEQMRVCQLITNSRPNSPVHSPDRNKSGLNDKPNLN